VRKSSAFRLAISSFLTILSLIFIQSPAVAARAFVSSGKALASSSLGIQSCGSGPVLVRPAALILTCADDGELAEHLHWSSWTAARATASEFVTWRAALCSDSKRWDRARANVTLSDLGARPAR
jgi:hypothetical protein